MTSRTLRATPFLLLPLLLFLPNANLRTPHLLFQKSLPCRHIYDRGDDTAIRSLEAS